MCCCTDGFIYGFGRREGSHVVEKLNLVGFNRGQHSGAEVR